ncbi:DNA-binding NarL/FixJ family response regulator [Azospirillum lipoferum]|uniref:Response regulator n=1 Tax=Azospirillum lipoferum TaxID=193 RepID=A0A5A9GWL4_AZOLI|nr:MULTISPECIES: response regulator [Azospirillum]KAA0598826.1 response regulator [Azospirillum lipoferum]MCP1609139.1 DNA-binding NarL/FixJ family response regulator [Azospirillum lipoferum]MDW5535551.1 response regulator [Azospirillum sp. NL1]
MFRIDTIVRPHLPNRTRTPGQPLRVILVEHDPGIADALSVLVADLGHIICGIARTESEAADLALRECPDLALTDVRLGGGDGIAAARRLNLHHGLRSIFLSGNSDHGTMARITETYPLGVVHKPFSHYQLKIALDLAARRLR